jgi:hypothetical protein
VRLGLKFYLGLGAPASRAAYPECRVRAAAGYRPELVRRLLALRRGEAEEGEIEEVNFRCVVIRPAGEERRFFFKEFPRQHALHDVERVLRCSRVDRAWRAAHLLPPMGILTPAPVGTAIAVGEAGATEYLATEWLPEAVPYHVRLRDVAGEAERREMLCEFARHLRHWHDCGIYMRDLVTNIVTRSSPAVESGCAIRCANSPGGRGRSAVRKPRPPSKPILGEELGPWRKPSRTTCLELHPPTKPEALFAQQPLHGSGRFVD